MSALILGLTGGIASGKSTVAAMFVARGFRHVDADLLARVAVEPGQPALEEIAAHFGPGVLHPDGRLDRAALGRIVFADGAQREVLNAITHPRIGLLLYSQLQELSATPGPILLDHPLLYETGSEVLAQRVAVVYVDRETQISRLRSRNGFTREEALQRIEAQMDLELKLRRADFAIDNRGDVEQTAAQVEQICLKLAAPLEA